MKVFVTGATGFVGREVALRLHAAGHRLRLLVRHPEAEPVQAAVRDYQAETVAGDVVEASTWVGELGGAEAVIHLVGIISEFGSSTFENVHVQGTANVVAAAQAAGVSRFIHMSALGARADARSRYHQTKWAAEEAVRHSGLQHTIFRPSIIYGRHDHFVNLFARIIRRSPVLPVLDSGQARFQPVAIENVALAFTRSLTEPLAIGQTYDLCGGQLLTLPAMLDQIIAVLQRERHMVRVPLGVARAAAWSLESIFPRLLKKAPPLSRDQLVMLGEDNVGDPRPANDLFRLEAGSFREGIARYLGRD